MAIRKSFKRPDRRLITQRNLSRLITGAEPSVSTRIELVCSSAQGDVHECNHARRLIGWCSSVAPNRQAEALDEHQLYLLKIDSFDQRLPARKPWSRLSRRTAQVIKSLHAFGKSC